jgi:hypothetical protein
MALHSRIVEHLGKLSTQLVGSYGFRMPDRLQHQQNVLESDVLNEHLAKDGNRVGIQTVAPLISILPIRQLCSFDRLEQLNSLAEPQAAFLGGHEIRLGGLSLLDGIHSASDRRLHFGSLLSRQGQADFRIRSKADFSPLRAHHCAQQPGPPGSIGDLQAKSCYPARPHALQAKAASVRLERVLVPA